MSEPKPEHWLVDLGQGMGPLRLGDTPDEVLRKLADAGIDYEPEEGDEEPIGYVDDLDAELKYKTSQPPVVLEIECWDERAKVGPLSAIDERLHTLLDQLHVQDAETVWRLGRINDQELPDGPVPIATDKELFKRGTLWIPHLGLGLTMLNGTIGAVCIRKPEEAPKRGHGQLTSDQRALSARSDLYTHLVGTSSLLRPSSPQNRWVQRLLTLAMVIAMGFTVFRAIDYQQQWNNAVVVQASVIEVKPPPPDPFPDEYTVTYRDQADQQHQVLLKRNDVYVAPQVGETVELRYLPQAPDKPLGPARYRDASFVEFVPIGIGILAVYSVLQLILPFVSMLFDSLTRAKQNVSTLNPET